MADEAIEKPKSKQVKQKLPPRPTSANGPRPSVVGAASNKSKSARSKRTFGRKTASAAVDPPTSEPSPAEKILLNITSPRGSVGEVKLANAQLGGDEIKIKPESAKSSKKGSDKKRTKLSLHHKSSPKNMMAQNIAITQGA